MKFIFVFFLASITFANCSFYDSNGHLAAKKNDALFLILSSLSTCPKDVIEFKEILQEKGLITKPTMVSNRGSHNTNSGSFSFFEMVEGSFDQFSLNRNQFFFGHFTHKDKDNNLKLSKQPQGLMIELIIWDPVKNLYNFYELIGDKGESKWFYRGDSLDILEDNKNLHLQDDPDKPVFGKKLRCSACHSSGGPIMKELDEPYNDWWKIKKGFNLKDLKPDHEVKEILEQLNDASLLAQEVKSGIVKLEKSLVREKSLQEILRPLFATMEINLASSKTSLNKATKINIPSTYWLDPRLGEVNIELSQKDYLKALFDVSNFPESNAIDANYPWLTPVKSFSDIHSIDKAIEEGIIDEHFVLSILAVDFKNPIFSKKRSSLLKSVPKNATIDWREIFFENIKINKTRASEEFLFFYQKSSSEIKSYIREEMKKETDNFLLINEIENLVKKREMIKKSEISKNPLGEILEPGFRVIFPDIDLIKLKTKRSCSLALKAFIHEISSLH